jgi:hypothetical protein
VAGQGASVTPAPTLQAAGGPPAPDIWVTPGLGGATVLVLSGSARGLVLSSSESRVDVSRTTATAVVLSSTAARTEVLQ